ncbi:MAG: FAD-binding oxidoreductase [Anaerolineales bacterium]|nr:FAD-binding oxidoreductase [Anaerolineales bacterium]
MSTITLENNFTKLENFGHSMSASSYLFCPPNEEQIKEAFTLAKKNDLTVTLRGTGLSYNDAALNGGGILLDMTSMNRILEWNPETGLVKAEPGVTLQQLWQHVLPDGWWPPVVSGTMMTTLGGCLGANIHGKNNFKAGTLGEHVVEFTAILPTGAQITCAPKKNGDLFYALISGLGLLGVFTSITIQMKKIYSGLIEVDAFPVHNLKEMLDALEQGAPENDYIVGWLDTTARGKGVGRGQIHAANYLPAGADPNPGKTQRLDYQHLPATLFLVIPKSILHHLMRPFVNNLGAWAINTAKYIASLRKHTFRQSFASFQFLLDYVPDWELSYGRDGLIQYQSFLPKETALETWTKMLNLSHQYGLPSYLGVTKRHRPDVFLISHALDGFSLALDFKVTRRNRQKLSQMLQEFDQIVLEAGGRFYFAKNSETTSETTLRFLGKDTIKRFKTLKKRTDPNNLLESDLYKRIFEK